MLFRSRSIPNARIMDLIQGFLYSIFDLFMGLYSPDHPIHKEVELAGGKNWKFERVRGTGGAPKVLTVYEDNNSQYLIQCTELSINIKQHSAKKTQVSEIEERTDQELIQPKDLPVVNHPDPGIDEGILWTLYSSRRKAIDEGMVWPDEFSAKYPLWSRGIITTMSATMNLYNEFRKNQYRIKSFDTVHLQPHHQMIWLLIAAEYFWLYNTREVNLPKDLTNLQAQVLMNAQFQDIVEEFRKLLPPDHPALKTPQDTASKNWKAERIRGTGGVPQIVFKISLPKGKEYLIKCTASVLSVQPLNPDLASIQLKEKAEGSKKIFIQETEESPLPIGQYSDPGLDENILWSLYSRKQRDSIGWEDHVTDTFPLWARATINAMIASKALFDDFHCSKRRYKRFESKRLQPSHTLIRFLITAEYYWLFNLREMSIPRELGFKESMAMQQSYLYDIQYEFIKLLPMQHPLRSKSPKIFRNWTAERISGSSGSSKVIVRLVDHRAEYLLEMTSSMVAVRKIKDFQPEA